MSTLSGSRQTCMQMCCRPYAHSKQSNSVQQDTADTCKIVRLELTRWHQFHLVNLFRVMTKPCRGLCNSFSTHCYVSVSSDEGAILSTLLYWVVAVCCVARWWTGCVAGSLGLVPGTLRSLPGHPRGGSVRRRSFPTACLQEMRDKGGALAGGREVETGEDR